MTRGNQRETDRARAAARKAKQVRALTFAPAPFAAGLVLVDPGADPPPQGKGPAKEKDGLTAQQRRDKDAAALAAKIAKKAAAKEAGGDTGGGKKKGKKK